MADDGTGPGDLIPRATSNDATGKPLPRGRIRSRQQALVDADRRAASGTYGTAVGWLVIVLLGDERLREHLAFVVAVSAALVALAATRLVLHLRLSRMLPTRERRAQRLLRFVVLANGAIVGGLCAASVHWSALAPSQTLLLLLGAAICSAVTMGLAMDHVLRIGTPLVVLGPVAVSLVLDLTDQNGPLLALLVLLAVYLLRASTFLHDDYWRSAETVALHRQRATELEVMSVTDTLTGLANRLVFDRRLAETWAHAAQHGGLVSLLLIDLDHFKRLNDTYGHPFGDRCLQRAARAIDECALRRSDLAARYGGEEFVILVPDTAEPAALGIAERVRRKVGEIEVEHASGPVALSCSVGVATMAPLQTAAACQALVDAADAALYQAKHAGRDRVVAAGA